MNVRGQIDPIKLKHLYVERGQTIDQLAAHFTCSPTTIRRRLIDLDITRRSRGPYVTRNKKYAWSPEIAYVIGVLTSDGNLSKDGRHLNITSADVDLLETVRGCLCLTNSIT